MLSAEAQKAALDPMTYLHALARKVNIELQPNYGRNFLCAFRVEEHVFSNDIELFFANVQMFEAKKSQNSKVFLLPGEGAWGSPACFSRFRSETARRRVTGSERVSPSDIIAAAASAACSSSTPQ